MAAILTGWCPGRAASFAADSAQTDGLADNLAADKDLADKDLADQDLMDLGRDFANKIRANLGIADLYLSGAGKIELAEHRARTRLPDDEPLLLRPIMGKSYVAGRQDIFAIKHDGRLLLSLADFISVTGVAIKANPDAGTAQGWFNREDQGFDLDLARGTVIADGKTFPVDAKGVQQDGNELLISAEQIEKWFGIDFQYNFSSLTLTITTPQPFPFEESYMRSQKQKLKSYDQTGPKLPVLEPQYGLITLPYIDTDLGYNFNHSPGQKTTRSGSWSTIASGDYAGFNTKVYVNGTDKQPYLDSARITMGKEDPTGNLLGPLHATSYRFGDVSTVSNALIGGSSLERGISISSKPLDNLTTKTTTQINGDTHPGWDVELYRNESFIDIRRVGRDGRYDFGDVDLIVGENDFKLLFYGPQGEREEKHHRIGVNKKALENNSGYYEASLTQQNLMTWQRVSPTTPGTGKLRAAASYERGIPGLGTVSAGIRSNSDQGQERTFLQSGIATYFWDTFYNADVGFDTTSGNYSSILTARRNVGKQSVLVQHTHNSKEYSVGSPDAVASVQDSVRLNISGPLLSKFVFFRYMNYTFATSYTDYYNDQLGTSVSGNITTRVASIVFTGGVQFRDLRSPGSATTPATVSRTGSANLGANGRFWDGTWRIGAGYQILPLKQFTTVDAEYNRNLTNDLSSSTRISYDVQTQFATGSLALNWQTGIATISPNLQYDTARNLSFGVNVHTSAGADPYTNWYKLYNNYLTETGGVAARIFRDKNGDGEFDDGDELLPDVEITAVQGLSSAVSNEKGIAFIPDLPKNRLTDIVVNPSSSDDAYGISLFKGVSIRPHPGVVTKLDFPIVGSGELDGQADYPDDKSGRLPARGLKVSLISPDGRVEKSATVASDGYWSISIIRPGIYYLVAETGNDNSVPGFFTPRLMEFNADGSTYFGEAVALSAGRNISFKFTSENPPPDGKNNARVIRKDDIAAQKTELSIGRYNSRLAMTLGWYKLRMKHHNWVSRFDLKTPLDQVTADPSGIMNLVLVPKTPMTLGQATKECSGFEDKKTDCVVHLVTTYKGAPIAKPTLVAQKTPPAMPAIVVNKNQNKPDDQDSSSVVASVPSTLSDVSAALVNDLRDYAAVNPSIDMAPLRKKVVILNLGSYNSRELMTVIWFKLKTRYASAVGGAHLLVKPTQSAPLPKTGKFTLRASLPGYDVEDAQQRCRIIIAGGQSCTVEILPDGLQDLTDARDATIYR